MKKHFIFYGIILILLGVAACWIFYEPDDLSHLKKTEVVTAGTEDAVALIVPVAEAIQKKDRRELAKSLLSHDAIDAGVVITNLMADPRAFTPVRVLSCTRLTASHRTDNLTVHVYSEPREKSYGFTMQKDKAGKYLLVEISSSRVKP